MSLQHSQGYEELITHTQTQNKAPPPPASSGPPKEKGKEFVFGRKREMLLSEHISVRVG